MAGGSGVRFGTPLPKQMVHIQGIPVLVHTLRKFLSFDPSLITCTVLHEKLLPEWDDFVREWFTPAEFSRILVCAGGATRTASVNNGLHTLSNHAQENSIQNSLVAIHDGVRPLITHLVIGKAYQMAEVEGNAVVAVPVKSSMRRKTEQGSEAVDRSLYYHVQTPQVFGLSDILSAYENRTNDQFTDDAGLAEAQGMQIHLCEGDYDNLKITTPEDLVIAEFLLKGQD